MHNTTTQLLHADLTYRIRGALFDVGNHLWPGLPERDFQTAVSIALARRRIPHELEEEFRIHYRDVEVGRYACDVTIDRDVVLELKVAPELTGLHRAQLISYLRVTGADVGLLVNFGAPRVEIERYAGFYAQRRPAFTWKPVVPADPTLLYRELVGRLYQSLYRVHYELGPGFFHHVYRRALQIELGDRDIPHRFVRDIPVFYEGQFVSNRRCRVLIVDDSVVVAAFAVRAIGPHCVRRMRHYLNHFDKKLGLLANFHGERLELRPVRLSERTASGDRTHPDRNGRHTP